MTDTMVIDRAIALFRNDSVHDPELKSTILYFGHLNQEESTIISLVNTVKPHFSREEIDKAIRDLKKEAILK